MTRLHTDHAGELECYANIEILVAKEEHAVACSFRKDSGDACPAMIMTRFLAELRLNGHASQDPAEAEKTRTTSNV
jgi:hypothetical protein